MGIFASFCVINSHRNGNDAATHIHCSNSSSDDDDKNNDYGYINGMSDLVAVLNAHSDGQRRSQQ